MKLSIVTINRNNLEGLKKTMKSVLSQTWTDFEWIIIDGASTDGSREYIESECYWLSKSEFNPVSFWCSEMDNGIYNALNKGIKHCQGDYVSCMNSGDEYYSEQTLKSVFEKVHNVDVLYGDAYMCNDYKTRISKPPENIDLHSIYFHSICHQAMFVRTTLLQNNPFDENYDICADYACWLRFVLDNVSFVYLNQVICRYDECGFSSKYVQKRRAQRALIQNQLLPDSVRKILVEYHSYVSCGIFLDQIRVLILCKSKTVHIIKIFVSVLMILKRMKNRFFIASH